MQVRAFFHTYFQLKMKMNSPLVQHMPAPSHGGRAHVVEALRVQRERHIGHHVALAAGGLVAPVYARPARWLHPGQQAKLSIDSRAQACS